MPRYQARPWYHPLGLMAMAPVHYAWCLFVGTIIVMYPARYRIADYWDRRRQGPEVQLRDKAVKFYQELERMNRRQALLNHPHYLQQNLNYTNAIAHNMTNVEGNKLSPLAGQSDRHYFVAHNKDALRAEKLLLEVRELQGKLAKESLATH